nr:helix-turn-helix domain-containing protein [uncultured Pseudomonas sp.]
MSLRTAFASALQYLRIRKGMSQRDIARTIDQSHVSRLEAGATSVSLEASDELAQALQADPMSLLTLIYASQRGESPLTVLRRTQDDLKSLGLLDDVVPAEPSKLESPRAVKAAELALQISALLEDGKSQAEVAKLLGIARSTVTRHVQIKK